MAEKFAGSRLCVVKLNEYKQKSGLTVEYKDIDTRGPPHNREFTVAVLINGKRYSTSKGKTKKEAKECAAQLALEILEEERQQELASRAQNQLPSAPSPLPQPSQLSVTAAELPEANYTAMLNEYAVKKNLKIDYNLKSQSGPPHMPVLIYTCEVDGKVLGRGKGNSKRAAKNIAAKEAYGTLTGQLTPMTERSEPAANTSTDSSFSDTSEVPEETSVNTSLNRLDDQINGLNLNETTSFPESPRDLAVKSKRKVMSLAPTFSKLTQRECKYTINDRFLEQFDDIEKLGSGGYGNVFKARHTIDNIIYAIKRVKLVPEKEDKIKQEVHALVKLQYHENIIQYSDSWIGQDIFSLEDSMSDIRESKQCKCLFIRMDYCEKGTLSNWISQEGRKESYNDEVLIKFQQIVNGVKFIHENNYIHRDLKPSNIFITKDDKIKIGDFGLVTTGINDLSAERTREKGTLLYMATEQQESCYGKEVDIFSLGVILFEMLCAFGTDHERVKELSKIREGIFPENFDKKFPRQALLIKKLIAKDPGERLSADEILRFLENKQQYAHTC